MLSTSPEINNKLLSMFLEQFLRVACLHKFIRYQTLDLSRVGHACLPKLVCTNHRPYEFPRQLRFMRYWINHNATVKKKKTGTEDSISVRTQNL